MSLGTLIFEMIVGLPPFYSDNFEHMYADIVSKPLHIPRMSMSYEAADLVNRLLAKDPSHRLSDREQVAVMSGQTRCKRGQSRCVCFFRAAAAEQNQTDRGHIKMQKHPCNTEQWLDDVHHVLVHPTPRYSMQGMWRGMALCYSLQQWRDCLGFGLPVSPASVGKGVGATGQCAATVGKTS